MIPGSGSWSYCQRIILTPARPWPWHLKHWHKKDVCRAQDKWYHLNILLRLFPITNNHHPSSSINFVKHLLRLGVEGGFLEMASILNRSNPLTQMTLMTTLQTPQLILSLNTFQPPISNIHHIPLTIGNMSYVQRTIAIACAISITMFFSWNL